MKIFMRICTYGKSIDFGRSIVGLSYYRIIDLEESEEERGGGGGDFT